MNVPTTNQNYFSSTLVAVVGCLNAALTALRCVGYTADDNSDCREHFSAIESAAATFGALSDKGLSSLINKEEVPNTVRLGAMISEFVVRRGDDDLRSFPSPEEAKAYSVMADAKNKGKCPTYVVERWPDRRITRPDVAPLEKKTAPQVTQVVTQPVVVPMSATVQTAEPVKVPISEVRQPRPINPNVTKQGNTSAPLAPPASAPKTTKDKGAKKEEAPAPVVNVKVPASYKELVTSGAGNIRALAGIHGVKPSDYTGKGSGVKFCAAVWAEVKKAAVPVSAPEQSKTPKETMIEQAGTPICPCNRGVYCVTGTLACKECTRKQAEKKPQAPVSSPVSAPAVTVTKAANDKVSGLISYEEADVSCQRCMRWARKGSAYCPICEPKSTNKPAATPAPSAPASKPASKASAAPIIVVAIHAECGSTLGYQEGMSEVPCPKCKCMVPTVDLDSEEDDDEDTEEEAPAPVSAPKTTEGAKKDKGATLGGKALELLSFLADSDDWMTQKQMSAAKHNNLGLLLHDHKSSALVVLGYVEEGRLENESGRTVKAYRITEDGERYLNG